MPVRTVTLSEELDRFVSASVDTGRYQTPSDVIGVALRSLERDEQLADAKLVALKAAIADGDRGEIVEGNVFAQIRDELRLPSSGH